MKVIKHDFDSNPDPVEVIANAMGGAIDGNIINGDNAMYKGTHLFFDVEEDITGILIDASYKESLFLEHKNTTYSDTMGLYFYLFDTDVDFFLNKKTLRFGKLGYNLLMIDGALGIDYIVNKGTNVYAVCIVINKKALRAYLNDILKIKDDIVFDSKNNVIINTDRANHQSLVLIKNFRKISPDTPYYEMSFKALVYALINNYLEQLKTKKMIVGEVVSDDIKRILVSGKFLKKNNEQVFPGIDFLAAKALMSGTKYKKLFNEVIGLSPAVYFYNSKLEKAKILLETKQYTVREISNKLNYSSSSFLARKFTNVYGISPKEYQRLL